MIPVGSSKKAEGPFLRRQALACTAEPHKAPKSPMFIHTNIAIKMRLRQPKARVSNSGGLNAATSQRCGQLGMP